MNEAKQASLLMLYVPKVRSMRRSTGIDKMESMPATLGMQRTRP